MNSQTTKQHQKKLKAQKASKNKVFITGCTGLLSAIFLYNHIYHSDIGVEKFYSFFCFFLIFVSIIYIVWKRKNGWFVIAIISGVLLGTLIGYRNIENTNDKQQILRPFFDTNKYSLSIEIQEVHKKTDYKNEYIAKLKSIDGTNIEKNIKALITIPSNFSPQKGYILNTETKMLPFKNSESFQYKNYMESKNIFFQAYFNSYNVETIKDTNILEKYIKTIRERTLNIITSLYPKEEGIFLGGILIGARENLPQELKKNFNNSGLTHFIAVSGFNITLLIVFLTYILKYFPIFIRVIGITLAIIGFTILVGDTAPVIRASLMGLIGYYVLSSGRQGNALGILMLTAVIMVVISPTSINYDVSLHLSFLAVLGIMYTQDFFMKIFSFLPNILEIKSAFVLTLSAMSFTLPIMVFNFGQLSIMAPFANIAVAWTIPIAMLLGFLSIIVHLVYEPLGIIVGYITWIFLKRDIMMVYLFGNLDWAILSFDFGIYKNHIQIIYFALLLFLVIWFRKREESFER